jgi:hypothetical protein
MRENPPPALVQHDWLRSTRAFDECYHALGRGDCAPRAPQNWAIFIQFARSGDHISGTMQTPCLSLDGCEAQIGKGDWGLLRLLSPFPV